MDDLAVDLEDINLSLSDGINDDIEFDTEDVGTSHYNNEDKMSVNLNGILNNENIDDDDDDSNISNDSGSVLSKLGASDRRLVDGEDNQGEDSNEIIQKKLEHLTNIDFYNDQDYKINTNLTIDSSLYDLQSEDRRLQQRYDLDDGVIDMKDALQSTISLAEFVSTLFPGTVIPDLTGFSIYFNARDMKKCESKIRKIVRLNGNAINPYLGIAMIVASSAVTFAATNKNRATVSFDEEEPDDASMISYSQSDMTEDEDDIRQSMNESEMISFQPTPTPKPRRGVNVKSY
ncbi:MAG: hypothetical protein N2B06_17200 [Clostridium sp.]